MEDTDLRQANLQRARLAGANLHQTYLQDADLRGADHLSRADLHGAHFQGAQLEGADFTGARVRRHHQDGPTASNRADPREELAPAPDGSPAHTIMVVTRRRPAGRRPGRPAAEPGLDGGPGFGLRVAGLQGGGQQHRSHLVDLQEPAATSWPRLNAARFKVALRRPGWAVATAPAPRPARPARSRPAARMRGWGEGWSAVSPVGPAAAAARPGPRAASPSGPDPGCSGGRWRAGRVGPRSARPGPASPPPGRSPTRLPSPVGAYSRCQPPPPVRATGPDARSGRSTRRRAAPPRPGCRPGPARRSAARSSGPGWPAASAATTPPPPLDRWRPAAPAAQPGMLARVRTVRVRAGAAPTGWAVCIGTTGYPRAAYTGAARAQPSSPGRPAARRGRSRGGCSRTAGHRPLRRPVTGRPSGEGRSRGRSSRPDLLDIALRYRDALTGQAAGDLPVAARGPSVPSRRAGWAELGGRPRPGGAWSPRPAPPHHFLGCLFWLSCEGAQLGTCP